VTFLDRLLSNNAAFEGGPGDTSNQPSAPSQPITPTQGARDGIEAIDKTLPYYDGSRYPFVRNAEVTDAMERQRKACEE
jgi:hypothetical protein